MKPKLDPALLSILYSGLRKLMYFCYFSNGHRPLEFLSQYSKISKLKLLTGGYKVPTRYILTKLNIYDYLLIVIFYLNMLWSNNLLIYNIRVQNSPQSFFPLFCGVTYRRLINLYYLLEVWLRSMIEEST